MKLLNQIKKKTNLGKFWLDEMKAREARMNNAQVVHFEPIDEIAQQPVYTEALKPHLIFQTLQSDEQKLQEIHEELDKVSYRSPMVVLA